MFKGLKQLAWASATTLVVTFAVSAAASMSACEKKDEKADKASSDDKQGAAANKPVPPDDKDQIKPAPPQPTPSCAEGDCDPALLDPSKATETAPDKFRAKFETTKGDFVIEVVREWSPNGADRFYNLVKIGFFDGVRFFRVVPGFMAQFGIHGDPAVSMKWMTANIQDDPVVKSNLRSYVTYAKSRAPNSRSTQFFINYADKNKGLDADGFSPFGKVVEGMDVVDALEGKYGESTTARQGDIYQRGNEWLDKNFPGLDYIKKATIVPADGQ